MVRARTSATAAATTVVRRSNRDRDAAITSATKAISRNGWTSLDVIQDEQDDEGVWHYGIHVRTRKEAAP